MLPRHNQSPARTLPTACTPFADHIPRCLHAAMLQRKSLHEPPPSSGPRREQACRPNLDRDKRARGLDSPATRTPRERERATLYLSPTRTPHTPTLERERERENPELWPWPATPPATLYPRPPRTTMHHHTPPRTLPPYCPTTLPRPTAPPPLPPLPPYLTLGSPVPCGVRIL